jgi:hypothetical protein
MSKKHKQLNSNDKYNVTKKRKKESNQSILE